MTIASRLEVVPAIDLLGGDIVRLRQGDFDEVTHYDRDPTELARRYQASGCKRLHVVDLDGARTGTQRNFALIEALASCGLEVQTGGGIRDRERLEKTLSAGATRAVVGSIAVSDPERVVEWIASLGSDSIVIAVDVAMGDDGEPEVMTHGWTKNSGRSLWPVIDYYRSCGARDFLCTDIARDGMLTGPNLELYAACVNRYPDVEFTASGGVSGIEDLKALDRIGLRRVVTGKALLDGRLTIKEIEQFSRVA